MEKKKIVIIGANNFQMPLIIRAKELGYETHVFAWQDGAVGAEFADYFYPISIIKKDEILEECRRIKPDAVTSIASDLAIITVNYLAQNLGLVGNTLECTKISTNKYEMRKAFRENGVAVPKFEYVEKTDEIDKLKDMELPLIVKPTDRSGSRAITKITDRSQLESVIKEAIKVSFEKRAIVEEFIDGEEYSAESISYNGEHTILAITKKETNGAPHFIETGHRQPSGLNEEEISKVREEVFKGLDSLKISNGASHAEFKIDLKGRVRIIEIGARMGGDCIGSDLVKISTGYDFVKMVIDVALGKKPEFIKVSDPKDAIIKFIFSEEDINELEKIKRERMQDIYYISPIDEINSHKIIDSSTRYGYYILAVNRKV